MPPSYYFKNILNEVNYFNIKAWVKNYFGLASSDKSFENTNNSLEFIWVWSIFEHKYFILRIVKVLKVTMNNSLNFLQFFLQKN